MAPPWETSPRAPADARQTPDLPGIRGTRRPDTDRAAGPPHTDRGTRQLGADHAAGPPDTGHHPGAPGAGPPDTGHRPGVSGAGLPEAGYHPDASGPAGQDGTRLGRRARSQAPARLPAWPLAGLLLLYPLWWALGLGVLIFPLMALPMAWILLRAHISGRPVRVPPGFLLWVLFLAVLVVGLAALGADPAGTVEESARSRLLGALFRIGEYGSLTVLLLYAGNLTDAELSRRRLVRLLAWLFVVTVAGGLLGVFAGRFEFTSPVELLLPGHLRNDGFVQSLVHPYAAQIMDLVGGESPRPAAPWGYTNTWGNNFCLLAGWFVAAVFGAPARAGYRVAALACLAISVLPVVYSLNRGLWIGLGVLACYSALRLACSGRLWAIGSLVAVAAVLATALVVTPLGQVVDRRLDNGKSNGVRMYLTEQAIDGLAESPVIGFGSTRTTLGGRNSIAVGESANCARCGNFTVGGNGQLWQLLFAHGAAGTLAYLAFFGYALWRFRRDRTPLGLAGSAAIVGSLVAMFWYNALVTPLAFGFLSYALLWRNDTAAGTGGRQFPAPAPDSGPRIGNAIGGIPAGGAGGAIGGVPVAGRTGEPAAGRGLPGVPTDRRKPA